MKIIATTVLLLMAIGLYFLLRHEDASLNFSNKEVSSIKTASPETAREIAAFQPIGMPESTDNLQPMNIEKIFTIPQGLNYRPIDQLDLPPEIIAEIRQELKDYQQYGSNGKGFVVTEFQATEELRASLSQKSLYVLKHGLAFEPVDLLELVGPNFQLIGADDHGKMIPAKGWSGFMQSLEDPSSGQGLELSETQLETQLGDGVEIIEEFLNVLVGDVRGSIQIMKDHQGQTVHSIEWADRERTFDLHTRQLSQEDSLALAGQILDRYRALPHQGWKVPFVLDPNILSHRLAIRRDELRKGTGKDPVPPSKGVPQ